MVIQNPSFHWSCWWSNFLLLIYSNDHFQCQFQFHYKAILGKKEINYLSILWPKESIKLSSEPPSTSRCWGWVPLKDTLCSNLLLTQNLRWRHSAMRVWQKLSFSKRVKSKQIFDLWGESIFIILPMLNQINKPFVCHPQRLGTWNLNSRCIVAMYYVTFTVLTISWWSFNSCFIIKDLGPRVNSADSVWEQGTFLFHFSSISSSGPNKWGNLIQIQKAEETDVKSREADLYT